MHAYDTLLAHHVTLHLLHGYSQPGYAMLWADALLRDSTGSRPPSGRGVCISRRGCCARHSCCILSTTPCVDW